MQEFWRKIRTRFAWTQSTHWRAAGGRQVQALGLNTPRDVVDAATGRGETRRRGERYMTGVLLCLVLVLVIFILFLIFVVFLILVPVVVLVGRGPATI